MWDTLYENTQEFMKIKFDTPEQLVENFEQFKKVVYLNYEMLKGLDLHKLIMVVQGKEKDSIFHSIVRGPTGDFYGFLLYTEKQDRDSFTQNQVMALNTSAGLTRH